MKRIIIATFIGLLLMSCGNKKQNNKGTQATDKVAESNDNTQITDIKSGIIEYKIKGSGNMMGQKMTTSGTGRLVFKEWGTKEREEREITETYNGESSGSNKELSIIKDGMSYDVDFEMHQITKTKDTRTAMMKEMNSKNYVEAGEKMMTQLGGKKTGTEKFKGYRCDVWELMGTKMWVYKGIPLKTKSDIMGITRTEEAVKIKFNTSVSDAEFDLPKNFQILEGVNVELPSADEMQENMQEIQEMRNMTYKEWKQKIIKENGSLDGMSEEQLKKTYEMIHKQLNN